MNRLKKWIRYVPDRIDDGLRYLCGRMSPDVRLICVVVMLIGFGCLNIKNQVDYGEPKKSGPATDERYKA